MKLIVNKKYKFTFAGSNLEGKYIGDKVLNDGTLIHRIEYNNCVYPVTKDKLL